MTEDDTTDRLDRLDRLESLVERQAETIEALREDVATLGGDRDDGGGRDAPVSRRGALKAGGLLALLGLGAGTASADPQGQVGTASDPLTALYTEELNGGVTGDTELTDLVGSGLAINAGSLEVSGVSQWTDADANGLLEPSDGTKTGIEVTDVQVDDLTDNGSGAVSLGNTLDLGGNAITGGPGNGVTVNTDGGSRTLELGVPRTDGSGNTAGGNVVAGHPNNTVNNFAVGVVIGGGGFGGGGENTVGGDYATVGGGSGNTASQDDATVGGGFGNTASGPNATVGGGDSNAASGALATVGGGDGNTASREGATVGGGRINTASGFSATVGGGSNNTASGFGATVPGGFDNTASSDQATVGGGDSNAASGGTATVGGGDSNTASAFGATVPGGASNTASGDYSFAAGRRADTNGHAGAFVFGDSTSTAVLADADDEAFFQMPVNGNFSNTSSRSEKTAVEPVSPTDVLDGVLNLDVATWEYTNTDESRHIGPMAEDFDAEFGFGRSDDRINTVDADGVALAAIQGLAQKLEERDERIDDLETTLERTRQRLRRLEATTGSGGPIDTEEGADV